jgi:hypothetical protein
MKLGATDFVRKPMTPEILRNAVAAALAKLPRVSAPEAPTSAEISAEPLIQIITMNGFTILDSEGARREPNERRFIVKSPTGSEHEVLVEIDEEAIGYVERMTRRKLPPENSFWTTQAQRVLGDYLWKGKFPQPENSRSQMSIVTSSQSQRAGRPPRSRRAIKRRVMNVLREEQQ